ncbi:2,4-dienoyl-CoA reductase [Solimonas aquatica]|uniref:2,4-dienoyl-CoA reductase n=1 Tax=Solimonas aquatica TaxID=489703 RepID=A0A1H9JGG2_9GAMM|nr:NADH:flavin oxidoreductase/NADH oxidase family protein [Solimonas aquatica]SEQ85932.1 2,4-dienoyl-CoA reductase [Solimonas aquatica]
MSQPNALAAPFTLPNGSVIKNRICKSAMSETMGDEDGGPKPELAKLYGAWADGGLGLCITGNVMIDARALGEPGNVVIEDERHLPQLKAWASAATRNGMQCWVQLNHPGKQSPKGLNAETVSPSAIPFRKDMQAMFATPRALRDEEVLDIIARFANAARIVKAAGFSGVQIHGAHGYLVSQFLSPHHNQRQDQWGGSAGNRRRFVLAVLKAMREQVGPDFPIGIKLNSADFQRGGFTETESLDTIRALAEAGIDCIEISGGTYEAPEMAGLKESTRQREAYFLDFAEQARKLVSVPLIVTGGFRSFAGMQQAVASGAVDLVGLARLLAVETDAPRRLLAGQDPAQKISLRRTGLRMIDDSGMVEISWYADQMKRIARGEAPDPGISTRWLMAKTMVKLMFAGRGRPQRLRAR